MLGAASWSPANSPTLLFFVESQFFLFHTLDQAAAVRENERCTRVVCDVLHAIVALGILAGLMAEHFAMEVVLQRFQNSENPNPVFFLLYVLCHVLAVPLAGLVLRSVHTRKKNNLIQSLVNLQNMF